MPIVVATDFSTEASQAARVGALIARGLGEPLHLVHVSQDPRAGLLVGTSDEHLLSEDRGRLREVAQALRDEFGLPVAADLAAGPVVDGICDYAERYGAAVLLVGASSQPAHVLGATSERVARHARVPVLAVRAPAQLLSWLVDKKPLRVLLGSDLGSTARHAEAFVSLLAQLGPVDVQVVFVANPSEVHARYQLPPPADPHELDPAAHQFALRDLDAAGQDLPWRDVRRVQVVSGAARPDAHLCALSEHADLVVVGARKRPWIAQVWYGSVARGVLRSASVSVASVPQSGAVAQAFVGARARVVVAATDFSPLGDEAIAAAIALATPGGKVYAVHVTTGVLYEEAEERSRARQQLRRRVPASSEGCDVHIEVLSGAPAEAIVGFGLRVGADILCLGSQGRSGLGAWILGSTSQSVLRRATVPVMLVPSSLRE